MDRKELIECLKLAQSGDKVAEHNLLMEIRDTLMRKRVGKYYNKNRQVEVEDIQQEFMIGVALNVHKAQLDVGDPIEYLLAQGVYRVRSYMRGIILKGTSMKCNKCGNISRLNMQNGQYKCKKCGSTDVTTQEVHEWDDGLLINSVESIEDFEAELVFNSLMEEFESTLDEGTNVYQIYMLIKQGINRNNPQIKNYIKEIATLWKCSQNNVLQTMRKLQDKLNKFAESQGMEIIDNKFVDR